MPWCPNCKVEYQDGIKICSDCGTELVESLNDPAFVELTELVDLVNEDDSIKLVKFLDYSGIRNVTSEYFSETSTWKVSVNAQDIKEAGKLYKAFLTAKTSDEENLEDLKKEEEEKSENHSYVKKEEKYNDFKSSAFIFLPFGILGLAFIALNLFGVLNLIGTFQMIILSICFIGFIYVGITSLLRLKALKEEVKEEQDKTSAIIQWMKDNITKDILSTVTDEDMSDEVNYIHQTDKIKEMVLENFKSLDENFIDQIVEDYYNKYIDS